MTVVAAFLWLGVSHFEPIASKPDADASQPATLKLV